MDLEKLLDESGYRQGMADLKEMRELRATIAKQIHQTISLKRIRDAKVLLAGFDKRIPELERELAEHRAEGVRRVEQHRNEHAREAELSKKVAECTEMVKRLYIITKHQAPHLLDSFTNECLAPLTPEMRVEFFNDVAVLESTQLDAILKGEA